MLKDYSSDKQELLDHVQYLIGKGHENENHHHRLGLAVWMDEDTLSTGISEPDVVWYNFEITKGICEESNSIRLILKGNFDCGLLHTKDLVEEFSYDEELEVWCSIVSESEMYLLFS